MIRQEVIHELFLLMLNKDDWSFGYYFKNIMIKKSFVVSSLIYSKIAKIYDYCRVVADLALKSSSIDGRVRFLFRLNRGIGSFLEQGPYLSLRHFSRRTEVKVGSQHADGMSSFVRKSNNVGFFSHR
jgi:hypothetical protein